MKTWTVISGVVISIVVIVIIVLAVTLQSGGSGGEGDGGSSPSSLGSSYYTSCDSPARDTQLGRYSVAAVSSDADPCASIAIDILKRNGSAADASIAAMFCVGVINFQSCGVGGGFVAIYYSQKEKKAYSLDAREVAPKASFPAMYDPNVNPALKEKTGKWWEPIPANLKGPLSVAVPGEVAGLYELYNKFGGSMRWADLLEPTIRLCEEGYTLTWYTGGIMQPSQAHFLAEPSMSIFVNETEGRLLREGEVVRRKQLAKTLRRLQEDPEALYKGGLADSFVGDLSKIGGIITKEDLLSYRPVWKEPVRIHLENGNYTVHSFPPPGSGLILGLILNILDVYEMSNMSLTAEEVARTHQRVVESFKYSYAKRYKMGDITEEESQLLMQQLTSDQFAKSIRDSISDVVTSQDPIHYGTEIVPGEDAGTAHFSLIAPNGDAVAITSSINYAFGAGIRSESTGIIYNNQMGDFTTPEALGKHGSMLMDKNTIQPGKRPLSSMSPTVIVDSEGKAKLVIGAGGGIRIPSAVAWVAARYLWMGNDLKEAINTCRSHHSLLPMEVHYEKGFPESILEELKKRGHNTKLYPWKSVVGAVGRDADGILVANSDHRKSGQIGGF